MSQILGPDRAGFVSDWKAVNEDFQELKASIRKSSQKSKSLPSTPRKETTVEGRAKTTTPVKKANDKVTVTEDLFPFPEILTQIPKSGKSVKCARVDA